MLKWLPVILGALCGVAIGPGVASRFPPPRSREPQLDPMAVSQAANLGLELKRSQTGRRVIVFLDYECPACRSSALSLKMTMLNLRSDVGMNIVHFPLEMHKMAVPAAMAVRTADKVGLGEVTHWRLLVGSRLTSKAMSKCIQDIGVGVDQWKMADQLVAQEGFVDKMRTINTKIRIRGTPSYAVQFTDGRVILAESLGQAVAMAERD